MLETLIAVLLGLAIRDVFLEIVARYQEYKFKKSMKDFRDLMGDLEEDFEADDEDD